jgi:hypothetical protein
MWIKHLVGCAQVLTWPRNKAVSYVVPVLWLAAKCVVIKVLFCPSVMSKGWRGFLEEERGFTLHCFNPSLGVDWMWPLSQVLPSSAGSWCARSVDSRPSAMHGRDCRVHGEELAVEFNN